MNKFQQQHNLGFIFNSWGFLEIKYSPCSFIETAIWPLNSITLKPLFESSFIKLSPITLPNSDSFLNSSNLTNDVISTGLFVSSFYFA